MKRKTLPAGLFAAALLLCPQAPAQDDPFGAGPSSAHPADADDPFGLEEPGRKPEPARPRSHPAGPLRVEVPDVSRVFGKGAVPAKLSPRFDLEFDGATIAEACEFIRLRMEDLSKEPFNIVVSKEASDIVLPTMTLRQITFDQFARFINRIGGSDPADPFGGDSDDPFADSEPAFPTHRGDRFGISDNDGIWYFWAEKAPESEAAKGRSSKDIMAKTFHVGDDAEPTLSLIEAALEATKEHVERPQPTLKFHEASKSLIVVGHVEDLELISDIVKVLKEKKDRELREQHGADMRLFELEMEKMKQRMKLQEQLAEEEKSQIKRQLETQILQLEAQLAEAKSMYAAAHPKIAELEARLAQALAELKQKK